jgi:hypothetical protein
VGQFRRQFFDQDDLQELVAKIAGLGAVNVTSKPALPPCSAIEVNFSE